MVRLILLLKIGQVLVFIEVKARFSHEFGTPLEAITPQKIRTLIRSINLSVHQHKLYNAPLRIDALGIDYTQDKDHPKIELVKNIMG